MTTHKSRRCRIQVVPHNPHDYILTGIEPVAFHCDGCPAETVDHPAHYNAHPSGVECITVVEHMSFNLGNAIKYLWRADEKGAPIEDLRKATWYVQREIDRRTTTEDSTA